MDRLLNLKSQQTLSNSSSNPWQQSISQLLTDLKSTAGGLDAARVKELRRKFADNSNPHLDPPSSLQILLRQFTNPLIITLIGISAISLLVGEHVNGAIILGMVIINAVIGWVQETKAEKSLQRLKKYVSFLTKVKRDHKLTRVNSTELVPGDIVYLNVGDIVPADIRLLEANNLTLDESVLTGESAPVAKEVHADAFQGHSMKHPIPQHVRHGVFMGTSITSGSAMGVVVSIAKDTFLGKSISKTDLRETDTQFQRSLKSFSSTLLKVVTVLVVFILIVNIVLGRGVVTSFLFAITVALGITPEVLPVIITIAVSAAAMKLSRKHLIVRRMTAIEDLGNVDVLCCDKTGTITEGKLNLIKGIEIDGDDNKQILKYALICNAYNPETKGQLFENPIDETIWKEHGTGMFKDEIADYKILDYVDFNFNSKEMTVLVDNDPHQNEIVLKGAVEEVLSHCNFVQHKDTHQKLTGSALAQTQNKVAELEGKGYRVIAVAALVTNDTKIPKRLSNDFVLKGLLLFQDPPRLKLDHTFAALQKLQVELKIITGDSPAVTAEICRQAGLAISQGKVILGDELAKLPKKQFAKTVMEHNVFARVTPIQKLEIIKALKEEKRVVGFIGDGINDVGALTEADVGISVQSATDVAKDSADIILLKRNLELLIDGIVEGRRTFSNTMKFIVNTMSSSYGNVVTIALSSLFLPFIPLLPVQVIMVDSLSDLQLLTISTDNVDKELLEKPQKCDMKFFIRFMIFFGLISVIFDLALIAILLAVHDSPEMFHTMWFLESVLSEIVATFAIRTRRFSFRSLPSFPLILTSILAVVFTFIIIHINLGKEWFEFDNIGTQNLLLIIGIVLIYFVILEVAKAVFYKFLSGEKK
ncbi:magnesium-translocating P-type ATPase [Candidatus Dojkabacteria bacterium]|uniref:Magnesium-transporting ATPase, P-type 1 n=1 Tax=Candidatus Dojkabacteria bacterium TaxID=2099670 RepID=A0A955I5J8_9BACT|nr:magnesium-translocating P-type ATPase [Candidatus Dojkabacteria bacterium]